MQTNHGKGVCPRGRVLAPCEKMTCLRNVRSAGARAGAAASSPRESSPQQYAFHRSPSLLLVTLPRESAAQETQPSQPPEDTNALPPLRGGPPRRRHVACRRGSERKLSRARAPRKHPKMLRRSPTRCPEGYFSPARCEVLNVRISGCRVQEASRKLNMGDTHKSHTPSHQRCMLNTAWMLRGRRTVLHHVPELTKIHGGELLRRDAVPYPSNPRGLVRSTVKAVPCVTSRRSFVSPRPVFASRGSDGRG